MTDTSTPSAQLDTARSERDRLTDAAASWHAQAAARRSEADDLEARIGSEVLASGDEGPKIADQLSAKVTELRAQVDVATRTAAEAEQPADTQARAMVRAAGALLGIEVG